MVRRSRLTAEFVDSVSTPVSGESWIADTLQPGFGLRLWAGKSGGGRAYAIRIRDCQSRSVRESFDPREAHWRFWSLEEPPADLGPYLEDAREWARDRIDVHKGRLTLREEEHVQHQRVAARVQAMTLGGFAELILRGMRANSLDESYVDRLEKLFGMHVPDEQKERPLGKVSPSVIAKHITYPRLSGGNSRVLRAFISQLYSRAFHCHGPLGFVSDAIQRQVSKINDRNHRVPHPRILKIRDKEMRGFLSALEAEESHWRQALAIRLYFSTGAPLRRAQQAQWHQFLGDCWYPYHPDEKVMWLESREHMTSELRHVLELVEERHRCLAERSPFLFPSAHVRSGHISSTQSYWQHISGTLGWEGLPLSHLVWRYRRRNNPSYHRWFINYYGFALRQSENLAEVSKAVKRRAENLYDSINYR